MNSSEKEKAIFRDLFIKSVDGQITPDEIQQFNALLAAYPDLEDYYVRCAQLQFALRQIRLFGAGDLPAYENQALWEALANAEKEAPAVKIVPPKEPQDLIQKVQHEKIVRKISKTSLFSLITAAAAVILIFVFAYFAPPATGIKVAVLSDSINAKWADADSRMEKGTPVFTSRKNLLLQEGYAKLLFDNNAQLAIEGPAAFEVRTEDQIKLKYGKIYAIIPREAIGFSVYTQNAKIIDLGTEFGVQADISGETSLYVIRGKTTLIAGEKSAKDSIEVTAGQAKRISANTLNISDLTFRQELFVRDIDSESSIVWKGQRIDLADIVGGGNGFGTGKIDMGIDPVTGKPSAAATHNQASANDYHPVPANPYIDGVFIPNGRTKQIVSSQGHIFQECPVSSGGWYISILNTIRILEPQATPDVTISDSPVAHCVLMHANMGITYDLQTIRNSLPQINIMRFQSKFGVGKEMDRPCNADFWILVDGKVRYKKQVQEKILFSVDIGLSDEDRFLTLVTTDGQDPEDRSFNNMPLTPYDSDWCFFADPVLIME